MFASELLPDLSEIVGSCPDDNTYRRLTDGVKLLNNKMLVDATIGEMAICVCSNFVTLPPEVMAVLGVQVDGRPSVIRNEWFTYHVNGPGDAGCTPCGFTDVLGTFCTFRDPPRPVLLVARLSAEADSGAEFRVYGRDANGNRIYTQGPDGNMVDGFLVPTIYGTLAPNADAPAIVQIERIQNGVTNDFVELLAVDPDTNALISTIGRYRPGEVAPSYQRIRVQNGNVVRVKYRVRDLAITGPNDWINVSNRLALVNAVRAAVAYFNGQLDAGQAYEGIAARLLREENKAQKPGGIAPPQVIVDGVSGSNPNMFYGGGGGYGW